MSKIKSLIEAFAAKLTVALDAEALAQARAAVFAAIGGGAPAPKRRGRPPKALRVEAAPSKATKPAKKKARKQARKKAPLQLCPVPGCRNPAAPVFGMVCAKHKDVSKATIKKYREARKAKKGKKAGPGKKAKRRVKAVATKAMATKVRKSPKRSPKPTPEPRTVVEAPMAAVPEATVAAG